MVDPIQRISPLASTGLSKLEASIEPPEVEPAPTIVWISSIKRTACGTFCIPLITFFRRFSKSPLYLAPASKAPISKANIRASLKASGTLPSAIRKAKPSAMAVLPTPGSPTKSGLFLRRRHKTSMVRSSSAPRPTRGSILPCAALEVSSTAYFSRASLPCWSSNSPSSESFFVPVEPEPCPP